MKSEMSRFAVLLALSGCLAAPGATAALAAEGASLPIMVNQPAIEHLNSFDEVDHFYFDLDQPGKIVTQLKFDYTGEYTATLFYLSIDGQWTQIQETDFSFDGVASEPTVTLSSNAIRYAAGSYRLDISRTQYGDHSMADYTVTVNYTAEPGKEFEKQPNGSGEIATPIETNLTITGNLDDRDDVDFYTFVLDAYGKVTVDFDYDCTGEYTLALYDLDDTGALREFATSEFSHEGSTPTGRVTEAMNSIRNQPGTYYLSVSRTQYGDECNADYAFTVGFTDETDGAFERQPNGTAQTSSPIALDTPTAGNLDSPGDIDYYTFEVSELTPAYLSLEYDDWGEYQMELFSLSQGGTLQSMQLTTCVTKDETPTGRATTTGDTLDLAAGTYYIAITRVMYSDFCNDDYNLTVVTDLSSQGASQGSDASQSTGAFSMMMIGSGASGSDASALTPAEYLVGTWVMSSVVVDGQVIGAEEASSLGVNPSSKFVFVEDGTGELEVDDVSAPLTWYAVGDGSETIVVTLDGETAELTLDEDLTFPIAEDASLVFEKEQPEPEEAAQEESPSLGSLIGGLDTAEKEESDAKYAGGVLSIFSDSSKS